MFVLVHKRRIPHVSIFIPFDKLPRWKFHWIAAQSVRLSHVGGIVFGLIDSHRIDFHRHLSGFHHVAKSGIEGASALRIVAVVALGTPVGQTVGEGPGGRDGDVEDQVTGLFGNFGSHDRVQGKVGNGKGMFPILSFPISFDVVHRSVLIDLSVGFGEPVQPPTSSGLPFDAEGVRGLEMFGNELLQCSDGIGLECLVFVAGDGFVLFGFAEVGSVEEGVE
mmetsp:Transcript_26305/g.55449  ORF Transcript_26305/g.55449 Transcript_26305/m.55449 type:complete len:221 (+) Transcript_26305:965-1627(+)